MKFSIFCVFLVLFGYVYSFQRESFVQNIPPNCGGNCYQLIQNAIQNCKQNSGKACQLNFQSGNYDIYYPGSTRYIGFFNFQNGIQINGNGATIIIHELGGVFQFQNCKDVLVQNLIVDFARVPFTLGQVVSVSSSNVVFKYDGSRYMFPSGSSWLKQVKAILEYNIQDNRPAYHGIDIYALSPSIPCSADTSKNLLTLYPSGIFDPNQLHVGSWYVLRHAVYDYDVMFNLQSQFVHYQGVSLRSGAGMGFYFDRVEGAQLLSSRVELVDNRPMSITADASHFVFSSNYLIMRDCLFEGQGDDGVNVHGNYAVIDSIVGANEAQVTLEYGDGPIAGDAIEIRDRQTFQLKFTSTLVNFNSGLVTFSDSLPSSVQKYDLLGAIPALNQAVLENNIYRNNRARGVLVSTNNVLINNCTFDHNSGPAIEINPDGWYWFQSSICNNITIQNSNIIGVNYGTAEDKADISIYPIVPVYENGVPTTQPQILTQGQVLSNLFIRSNTIQQDQAQMAVQAYATNTIDVSSNLIYFYNQPESNVLFANSVGTTANANKCFYRGQPTNCMITNH